VGTRLALCHDPESADELAARRAALILSGHTHGGQINIRGITDRIARGMRMRYMRGFYSVGEGLLYVTSGVGFTFVRWRTGEGTGAEVALLTLRAASFSGSRGTGKVPQ
jgi:predicted MPP superfamily phosphohydrolase